MIIKKENGNQYLDIEGNEKVINIDDTSIVRYKWKFKILSSITHWYEGVWIGLTSKTEKYGDIEFFCMTVEHEGSVIYRAGKFDLPNDTKIVDVIEMVLNLENKKLGFRINNNGDFQYHCSNEKYWETNIQWIKEMGFKLWIKLLGKAAIELISFDVEQGGKVNW